MNNETDVRYIRITDIDEWGNLKIKGSKTAPKIEEKYLLENNDLLIARSGSVGKTFLYRDEYPKSIFAGYLIRFKINEHIALPQFAFDFTFTSLYKNWVEAIQRPAVQANINSEEFKSLLIPIPPLEKQKEIANKINKIRNEAKHLQEESKLGMENVQKEIEKIILN